MECLGYVVFIIRINIHTYELPFQPCKESTWTKVIMEGTIPCVSQFNISEILDTRINIVEFTRNKAC